MIRKSGHRFSLATNAKRLRADHAQAKRRRGNKMKHQMFDLSGKVAIVTGGNGGIGLGLARGLANAGANIAIVGRNEAKSKAAVDDIAARGVKAIAVVADVTDKAAVARMVERVAAELGRIDILANNAGINVRKPPHLLEIEEWESVIDTTSQAPSSARRPCIPR
jgi:2-dehydro-3-deoxy-D-gluconate 5-dehydrogenase